MTTYRGTPVEYAVHNRKDDAYALIGADGECVAELKAREFLMLPNRGQLEVRSGRYRPTRPQDQCGADGKSREARRKDADARTARRAAKQGPSPCLTLANWAAMLGTNVFLQAMMESEEKPKPPLKREGIVAGEIVGFRCWRVEHGLLRSVYQGDHWHPGQVLQGRELGDWDSRGIHAWKDPASKEYHDYIRGYLNNCDPVMIWAPFGVDINRPTEKRPAMVTGTAYLWGDVVEHERGWRAEFARVRSLDWLYPDAAMMGREMQTLGDLRALYGVAA